MFSWNIPCLNSLYSFLWDIYFIEWVICTQLCPKRNLKRQRDTLEWIFFSFLWVRHMGNNKMKNKICYYFNILLDVYEGQSVIWVDRNLRPGSAAVCKDHGRHGVTMKPCEVLTANDITRLIMPSLSSPCLPLRLNHSSTTFPSRRFSGMVTCVHAILSSMEKALWMAHRIHKRRKKTTTCQQAAYDLCQSDE